MAILFKTSAPQDLLDAFKKAIDAKRVVTWTYDKDDDFTHTPDQWHRKAWLRPVIQSDSLLLRILAPRNSTVSMEAYAVYHGRFIEAMLAHCDTLFADAVATALPSHGDNVS